MDKIKTNGDLLDILHQCNIGFHYSVVLENKFFGVIGNEFTEAEKKLLVKKLRNFCNYASNLFKIHSLSYEMFKIKTEKWCHKEIKFPVSVKLRRFRCVSQMATRSKSFSDCSERQKRRRSSRLSNLSYDEIMHCTAKKMKLNNKNDERRVLKFITNNPANAKKVREFCDRIESDKYSEAEKYSKEMALAISISAKLTREKYNLLRNSAKQFQVNYYPSYNELRNAKKDCYPDQDSIIVTENGAKIKLQRLLDHTSNRLIKALEEKQHINVDDSNDLSLITKWGCDGAAGQSGYKQRFYGDTSNKTDDCVFMFSSVIRLIKRSNSQIVWENEKTSSTWYCRPIEFSYTKESTEVIKEKVSSLQKEVEELRPTIINTTTVSHQLILTMIDGKVCNAITENESTMRCYICQATSKEMNDLEKIKQKISNSDFYEFGLSSLHAWIRCFECLLHISYNMEFKKWCARTQHEKAIKKARKEIIQAQFKEQMGLNVDIVKQGFGTTNDGNTARRFFRDPAKSAQITGLDENLIKRFAVILQSIASNEKVNIEKFTLYTKETAEIYVSLYSWYYMPPTVHKILTHGADIIKNAIVPIGQLSEEAQESRNKDFRNYREYNARKVSRIANNQDLLNNLLISSDPYITMLRYTISGSSKMKHKLFTETLDLLDLQQEDSDISDTDGTNGTSDDDNDEEVEYSDTESDKDNSSSTADELSDD